MKTVKGKIVTGVVTLGLLSGVGAAFANTDAGAQLKAWYDKQFGSAASTIESAATKHATDQLPALEKEYNAIKTGTGSDISDAQTFQTDLANGAINSAKQSHINKLNGQKDKIVKEMDSAFAGIVAFAQAQINSAGKAAYQYAQTDLGNYTDAEGKKAITGMTTKLNTSKDKAVQELKDAIAEAKLEIQKQLDFYTEDSTTKINLAIDTKIKELRSLITKKAEELLEAQKSLIAYKAQELENTAKAELDSVIDGI